MGYRWETAVSECSQICPGQQWHQLSESSSEGLLLHTPLIGPYNTERLILFLEELHCRLAPVEERWEVRHFVIICDNVAFHHSRAVNRVVCNYHADTVPASILTIPQPHFFSAWRGNIYDHNPHTQMSLLDAMNAGCEDTSAEECQAWIRHAKRCLARENIPWDVDENMWPNAGAVGLRLFGFCL